MEPVVSGAKIAAMAASGLVALAAPVALTIFWRKKTGAKLSSMCVGVMIFVLFVYVLENAMHQFCLAEGTPVSAFIKTNQWAYVLYAGLAAGIFEETGRFFAFKVLMKKRTDPREGVMYGIGHGGIEAILVCTFSMITNIGLAITLNTAGPEAFLSGVPEASRAAVNATVNTLTTMQAGIFLVSGVERLIAICLHIALSVLVFAGARIKGKGYLYPVAILLHAGVDCFAVLYSIGILPGILVTELGVAVLTAAIGYFAWRVYKMNRAMLETVQTPVCETLEG